MKKNSFLTSMLVAAVLATANIVFAADRTIVKDGETINIQDKTFNNIQYEGAGGAVSGRIANINNVTFTNNYVKSNGVSGGGHWL